MIRGWTGLVVLMLVACASAPIDDWRWRVISADLSASRIEVVAGDRSVTIIDLACNLSEHGDSADDDGSSPRIADVRTAPYPNGLLVIRCPTGAHSVLVAAFDPATRGNAPVFERIGNYFADWRIEHGVVIISYDVACEEPGSKCDMPFRAIEESIEL